MAEQAGKLKFFGTRPNWVVSYIVLYSLYKFHSPSPVFHSPDQIFTRIGERASASFQACWGIWWEILFRWMSLDLTDDKLALD